MIDGHGDDFYKFNCPITANFSSNVYGRVDLSRLKAHLCECIGEIGSYPEPEVQGKGIFQDCASYSLGIARNGGRHYLEMDV